MGFVDLITKWLGIVPAQRPVDITIYEVETHELAVLRNSIWYRGDPVELEQFFHKVSQAAIDSLAKSPQSRFWAAVPTLDTTIRKLHTGLPRLIVDKLAGIVADDMSEPDMEQQYLARWKDIAENCGFDELVKDAIVKTLAEGDGAFKFSIDPTVSKFPLLEFFSGNSVDFVYKRGQLVEVLFYTDYFEGVKRYRLCEHYGKGYVRYKLYNSDNKEVDLSVLPETADLRDAVFSGDYIMAVPLKFYKSAKFPHRGESIFEGKSDSFDAFDEVVSTWMDALRSGRVKQYIPESLVPRDEDTGALRKPNVFNAYYIKNTDLSEEADNKIEVVQGQIQHEGLLASYTTWLDLCLQGLISPSTLGIDVKKLDNAESQREKEKTTLYTRDTIIGVLLKVLPKVVETALRTEDNMFGRNPGEYESSFEWGQYANPSFEAMVETVGKARQYGIMSLERCVDELYGDGLTEEEKLKEVERLKAENSVSVEEPAVNDDFSGGEGDDSEGDGGGDGEKA